MKIRKILCVLLAAVLLAGLLLTGCGKAETQLVKCARAMSKTSGLTLEPAVEMALGISIMGQEEQIEVKLGGNGELVYSPFALNLTLSSENELVPMNMLVEMKQTDGGLLVRISTDGGATWTESEKEVNWSEGSFKMDAKTLLGIAKSAQDLEELGTQEVRGSEATGYGYTVSGDMLADTMKEGIPISGTDLTIEPEAFRGTDGVKLEVWIDNNTNLISRIEADLSDMFSTVMTELLKNYVVQLLEEQLGDQMALFQAMGIDFSEMLEISIPTFKMSVEAIEYQNK